MEILLLAPYFLVSFYNLNALVFIVLWNDLNRPGWYQYAMNLSNLTKILYPA